MNKRHKLLKSLYFGFKGIWQTIRAERNLKIHLSAAILVIIFGLFLGLTHSDWLAIIIIIAVIIAAEIFNAAIEQTCDLVRDKLNLDYEATRNIRDVSAGAALILAIASLILACLIFLPYLR